MKITIIRNKLNVGGYPVLACHCCAHIWHLPQCVRWDELARLTSQASARTAGWHVPDDGLIYCADCNVPECGTGVTT